MAAKSRRSSSENANESPQSRQVRAGSRGRMGQPFECVVCAVGTLRPATPQESGPARRAAGRVQATVPCRGRRRDLCDPFLVDVVPGHGPASRAHLAPLPWRSGVRSCSRRRPRADAAHGAGLSRTCNTGPATQWACGIYDSASSSRLQSQSFKSCAEAGCPARACHQKRPRPPVRLPDGDPRWSW